MDHYDKHKSYAHIYMLNHIISKWIWNIIIIFLETNHSYMYKFYGEIWRNLLFFFTSLKTKETEIRDNPNVIMSQMILFDLIQWRLFHRLSLWNYIRQPYWVTLQRSFWSKGGLHPTFTNVSHTDWSIGSV